jgi:hypothetical protein
MPVHSCLVLHRSSQVAVDGCRRADVVAGAGAGGGGVSGGGVSGGGAGTVAVVDVGNG